MNSFVELPIIEPLYATYQFQGPGTAILKSNPSIINWYLNEAVNLTCDRRFLTKGVFPEANIVLSSFEKNPYIDQKKYSMEYLKGYVNPLIRELLDNGYYVYFNGVDDYYVKGKSLYKTCHLNHDGLICGYNQNGKTYCLYAYDTNWVYRKFWTTQRSFNEGRKAMQDKGEYGYICGIKPKSDTVCFSVKRAYENIKEYLNSSLEKYPFDCDKDPYGMVVQLYMVKYLDKLIDGSVPYERMDRRVFRLIWEHKKAMLKRIELIEDEIQMKRTASEKYENIVRMSDNMRLLYASYRLKKRDAILPLIKSQLLKLFEEENKILTEFIKDLGDELKE